LFIDAMIHMHIHYTDRMTMIFISIRKFHVRLGYAKNAKNTG